MTDPTTQLRSLCDGLQHQLDAAVAERDEARAELARVLAEREPTPGVNLDARHPSEHVAGRMDEKALRPIAYGTLPLASFIGAQCVLLGESSASFLAGCRKELAHFGPCAGLLKRLHSVGVTWRAPSGCTCGSLPCVCIERDVDAVVAAERDEAADGGLARQLAGKAP